MGGIVEHKKRIQEHIQEINDAIDIGIEKRPATIGFHTSACAVELLEVLLHKLNMISSGKMIKHNWFVRPKKEQKILPLIERKLPVVFDDKEKVYELIYSVEENRDTLIYAKSTRNQIETTLNSFVALREIIEKKLQELGEKID